ncbi:unnamed protein product [Blepharisma stoltei]|uniref:Uncharacterized protein n=1 Tax=Blepharisma stoltei TaxID=1481888 RepID=A0AAU9IAC5_9CILI|nr:unnamed protein product [Blepharisma stoltei]
MGFHVEFLDFHAWNPSLARGSRSEILATNYNTPLLIGIKIIYTKIIIFIDKKKNLKKKILENLSSKC